MVSAELNSSTERERNDVEGRFRPLGKRMVSHLDRNPCRQARPCARLKAMPRPVRLASVPGQGPAEQTPKVIMPAIGGQTMAESYFFLLSLRFEAWLFGSCSECSFGGAYPPSACVCLASWWDAFSCPHRARPSLQLLVAKSLACVSIEISAGLLPGWNEVP